MGLTSADFEVVEMDTDLLIIGGGMSACGAAVEAKYWAGDDIKVLLVDKAALERSGAVAMGLSAINTYPGWSKDENTIEDYIKYVTQDLMGISREDLVWDMATHVDGSVHLFEKWGLPIWKDAEGKYIHEGRWQIMIHGESYKPIVAEAAKRALGEGNYLERVFIVKLLLDENEPNRIAGAVGFSVRENKFYVIKCNAAIVCTGGGVHIFRPRSVQEGLGRTWYPPWSTGSTYAMMGQIGAKLTQMEVIFIPARFKDGYGPVGAWFLFFAAKATNIDGEEYMIKNAPEFEKWAPYGTIKPLPTCLRNHAMMVDMRAGKGPLFVRTDLAMQEIIKKDPKRVKTVESEAWEDFLDMTITQADIWCAYNVHPEKEPWEIMPAEPYFIGSHSGQGGAWCSGDARISPPEYCWDYKGVVYNRMTTVNGLFAAGDGCGGNPHKFSSGSHAEGRIAAKNAIKFILNNRDFKPTIGDVQKLKEEVLRPLDTFEKHKGYTSVPDINPNYIRPRQMLHRIMKCMDEYAGGVTTMYNTNKAMLEKALQLLNFMKEDSEKLAAENLHELMRCWENYHRIWTAEAHVRHKLFREETRWPGYYYRADFPSMDDENWRVFTVSQYDPASGEWKMEKVPYISIL